MSSRPLIKPHSVMTNKSMATSLISDVTIIDNMPAVSYDIAWSNGSTPVGVMSVQVSNSYSVNADGTVRDAGNWTTLSLSSPPSVSGNSGNGFIDIGATSAYAIRLVYTRTSGSGIMNAKVVCKVL